MARKPKTEIPDLPRIGEYGRKVRLLQESLGLEPTGTWGHANAQAVADTAPDDNEE